MAVVCEKRRKAYILFKKQTTRGSLIRSLYDLFCSNLSITSFSFILSKKGIKKGNEKRRSKEHCNSYVAYKTSDCVYTALPCQARPGQFTSLPLDQHVLLFQKMRPVLQFFCDGERSLLVPSCVNFPVNFLAAKFFLLPLKN